MKTKPSLTLDDCKKIAAAREAEARRNDSRPGRRELVVGS
jgi:hypothetical protein